ncbi:hypothetical protein [Halobacteriovorax sp. YZS-1-1]|uniref:hypothetical protein n=1 Tax=unclassified Halobacteriovorax TaxID=2639665 RepID=UPI00399ABF02
MKKNKILLICVIVNLSVLSQYSTRAEDQIISVSDEKNISNTLMSNFDYKLNEYFAYVRFNDDVYVREEQNKDSQFSEDEFVCLDYKFSVVNVFKISKYEVNHGGCSNERRSFSLYSNVEGPRNRCSYLFSTRSKLFKKSFKDLEMSKETVDWYDDSFLNGAYDKDIKLTHVKYNEESLSFYRNGATGQMSYVLNDKRHYLGESFCNITDEKRFCDYRYELVNAADFDDDGNLDFVIVKHKSLSTRRQSEIDSYYEEIEKLKIEIEKLISVQGSTPTKREITIRKYEVNKLRKELESIKRRVRRVKKESMLQNRLITYLFKSNKGVLEKYMFQH